MLSNMIIIIFLNLSLLGISLLLTLSIIVGYTGQVDAIECKINESDFPFCKDLEDDQEQENEVEKPNEDLEDDQEQKNEVEKPNEDLEDDQEQENEVE
jgi:hypothetical protein